MKQNVRRHVGMFAFWTLIFLAICLWATSRLEDTRLLSFNFWGLAEDDIFVVQGLSLLQLGELKIGFSEQNSVPQVGVFGNHQMQHFSKMAFQKKDLVHDFFFNYWHADISLTDVYDLLLHLEKLNKLPTRLIIVQVTTPNNDNGRHIIERSKQMPSDIDRQKEGLISLFQQEFQSYKFAVERTFDYSQVMLGLFSANVDERVVNKTQCSKTTKNTSSLKGKLIDKLPYTLRRFLGSVDTMMFCNPLLWHGTVMRWDGSMEARRIEDELPVINANSLDPNKAWLEASDGPKIRNIMQKINDLGRRTGRDVVIFIPPVYETARASIVDQIFDSAIKGLDGVTIIDDRSMRSDIKFFNSYDHPSHAYYVNLSPRILERTNLR